MERSGERGLGFLIKLSTKFTVSNGLCRNFVNLGKSREAITMFTLDDNKTINTTR